MQENETLVAMFTGLFEEGLFSTQTIKETMGYCLKVFGNVRAKDLCYRYNSNLRKAERRQGLRQNLASAAGRKKAGKPSEKERGQTKKLKQDATTKEHETADELSKLTVTQLKGRLRALKLPVSAPAKQDLIDRLIAHLKKQPLPGGEEDDGGAESDEEPEIRRG